MFSQTKFNHDSPSLLRQDICTGYIMMHMRVLCAKDGMSIQYDGREIRFKTNTLTCSPRYGDVALLLHNRKR